MEQLYEQVQRVVTQPFTITSTALFITHLNFFWSNSSTVGDKYKARFYKHVTVAEACSKGNVTMISLEAIAGFLMENFELPTIAVPYDPTPIIYT